MTVRLLLPLICATFVSAAGIDDLQHMIAYTQRICRKDEPELLRGSPFLHYLIDPICYLRETTVKAQKASLIRINNEVNARHAQTLPAMQAVIENASHPLISHHLKKFNLPLFLQLLSETWFPTPNLFINTIATGIPQWGRIPEFGIFPEETRENFLQPSATGDYANKPPDPKREFATPRIKISDDDSDWLNANLDNEIAKKWHTIEKFPKLRSVPSEGFVVHRAGKPRAVYNDAAPGAKNKYTFTQEAAGLMSFRTILSVLQLITTNNNLVALTTPIWQSAKSLYKSIELIRKHDTKISHQQQTAADKFTKSQGSPPNEIALIFLDLKAAYRQFPVRFPESGTYATYCNRKKTWRYTYSPLLMFGATPSIYFFAALAIAITSILARFNIIATMYVDDIIIFCHPDNVQYALNVVRTLLQCIGLTLAEQKTAVVTAISESAPALGFSYKIHEDGKTIHISLPQSKIIEIKHLLTIAIECINAANLTHEHMEKLTGNLIWAGQLRRFSMLRFLSGSVSKWTIKQFFKNAIHAKAAKNNLKDTLKVILDIIMHDPPVTTIGPKTLAKKVINFISDAAKTGHDATFGAFMQVNKKWYYYSKAVSLVTAEQPDQDALQIDDFEALAVTAALNDENWRDVMKDSIIHFYIDNTSSGYGLVKLAAKRSTRLTLIKQFIILTRKYNITPVIHYVKSASNISDALTREREFYYAAVAALGAEHLRLADFSLFSLLKRTTSASAPATKDFHGTQGTPKCAV